MGRILRYGTRNLWRSPVRSIVVVLLLALPFFAFLMMAAVGRGIDNQVNLLEGQVDTLIQLNPPGSLGHVNMAWNQHRLLPDTALAGLKGMAHAVKIEPYLIAMEPVPDYFMIMHMGVKPGDPLRLESHGEVGNPRIIAGRNLQAEDSGQLVAVIGRAYGEKFGITPETLAADTVLMREPPRPGGGLKETGLRSVAGLPIRIVGIFSSGYTFGDNQLFLPLETFQAIYGTLEISRIYLTVDSAAHVPAVVQELRRRFGDSVEIITAQAGARFVSRAAGTLRFVATIWLALLGASMAAILLLAMLLATRDRTRELGILKAIGASNSAVALLLIGEASALAVAGSLAGSLAYALLAPTVGQAFFTFTTMVYLPIQYGWDVYGNLGVNYRVSLPQFLALLATGVCGSVLGSLCGMVRALRMRPVDAMRDV